MLEYRVKATKLNIGISNTELLKAKLLMLSNNIQISSNTEFDQAFSKKNLQNDTPLS